MKEPCECREKRRTEDQSQAKAVKNNGKVWEPGCCRNVVPFRQYCGRFLEAQYGVAPSFISRRAEGRQGGRAKITAVQGGDVRDFAGQDPSEYHEGLKDDQHMVGVVCMPRPFSRLFGAWSWGGGEDGLLLSVGPSTHTYTHTHALSNLIGMLLKPWALGR